MKKSLLFLSLILISLFAQRDPNSEYWNTWHYKPKDGMVQKFEAAAAEKTKKFNATPENTIVTYKVVTGSDAGVYERIMPFQSAKSYNQDKSEELKYWADKVGIYCTALGGSQRWERLKMLDVNTDSYEVNKSRLNSQRPSKYLKKQIFLVKLGKREDFMRFAERYGKIVAERIPDEGRAVFRLVSGGNRNMFVAYTGFDSYERQPIEFDTTMEEAYNKMFGDNTWDRDIENFYMSLEMWGYKVETLELVEALLP